jgi:osmotically-inducible protein OsmY
MRNAFTTFTVGALLIAFTGAPAIAADVSSRNDALIQDFVLVTLAERAWVGGDFKVEAKNGTVTLRGTVPSEGNKARMGRIARDTLGVIEVRNELTVRPAAASVGTNVRDDELARRVARQVASAVPGAKTGEDWWLEGWRVEGPDNVWSFVIEANDGRVFLEGDVPRLSIMRKAIDAARQTQGVLSVRSDLELERIFAGYPYAYPYAYPYHPYAFYPGYYDPDYLAYDIDVLPRRGSQADGSSTVTTLAGRVTSLDQQSGRITLQTESGSMQLSLPPSALKGVRRGHELSVQIDTAAQPAASPAIGDGYTGGQSDTK